MRFSCQVICTAVDYKASLRSIRTLKIPVVLRAAVSVSILAVILSRISLEELGARAKAAEATPLAAALLLYLLMALLVSVRWRYVAAALGLAVPMPLAARAVFLGLFGGQLLPSTVGTDVLRGWIVHDHVGDVGRVAVSLIADRLIGLFAAVVLVAFSFSALAAAGVLALGIALIFFLPLHARPMLGAVGVGVAIHVIAVVAAAVTAMAYGVNSSLWIWLAIAPIAVIVCAVPVSINGWGVRESVFVALGATHGIAAADALIVAMTLGALIVLASLPGAYVLLRARRA